MKSLELKIPPLIVVIVTGLGMWATSRALPGFSFRVWGGIWTALMPVGLGVGIVTAGVVSFRLHRTTMNPLKPQAATTIVTTGIYRFTRNPMYLGIVLVLVGWTVYLANVAAAPWLIAFVAYMTKFQIEPEERTLLALFGREYTEYAAKVRRWL